MITSVSGFDEARKDGGGLLRFCGLSDRKFDGLLPATGL
jgi:hypothetical protein